MDPGTALAVVSLSFQLLGGCVKGFILLTEAHHAGKAASSLVCLLSIQESRLLDWARRAGLLSPLGTPDRRLNATAVESVLIQLSEILGDVDKLSKRYKLRLATARPDNSIEKDTQSSRNIIGIAISDDARKDILWRARLIQDCNSLPKRLWWAAFDQEKFKEMVRDVQVYVQQLWDLLDSLTQDDLIHNQELMLSRVIALTSGLDDVRTLLAALSETPAIPERTAYRLPLVSIAAVKAAQLEAGATPSESPGATSLGNLSQSSAGAGLQDISFNEIEIPDTNAINGDHLRLATYQNQKVFVEWKDIPSANRWKLIKRAEQLAHILHIPKDPAFRSLECLGVSMNDEASRAAFIFRLPSPTAQYSISLREMLSGRLGPASPSVTARVRLALQVLQSIRCFHIAGWMHKNLRSENIAFFSAGSPTLTKDPDNALRDPTLIGFAFSRLDRPGEITQKPSSNPARDIYRHPHSLEGVSTSYQPFMDLYSIGTIMIEIAEWRPLGTLVKEKVDVKKASSVPLTQLATVRPWLCQEAWDGQGVVKLEFRMGRRYARATRLCLGVEGVDGTRQGQTVSAGVHPIDSLALLDEAVRELEGCVI